jgi:hypothetical protein
MVVGIAPVQDSTLTVMLTQLWKLMVSVLWEKGERMESNELSKELYRKWLGVKKAGCCKEWKKFEVFYAWAVENGYEIGNMIRKTEYNEPHSPKNTSVRISEKTHKDYRASEFCALWNKTVNRFRKHEGLSLFEVEEPDFTEKTCKDCVHYKVCKYKMDDTPVCDDFLD